MWASLMEYKGNFTYNCYKVFIHRDLVIDNYKMCIVYDGTNMRVVPFGNVLSNNVLYSLSRKRKFAHANVENNDLTFKHRLYHLAVNMNLYRKAIRREFILYCLCRLNEDAIEIIFRYC
jgi:hypothetical protein